MSKETDEFIKHFGFDQEIIVECNYGSKSNLKHLFNEHEKWLAKSLGIANIVVRSEQLCQTCNGSKKLYDKVFGVKVDCPDCL